MTLNRLIMLELFINIYLNIFTLFIRVGLILPRIPPNFRLFLESFSPVTAMLGADFLQKELSSFPEDMSPPWLRWKLEIPPNKTTKATQ
ncbi:MAG: hypothetical protein CM15mP42_08920 [Methanobacteriota archaeon]|nr:MAG: hypothetical protein CM15mP42_08920 [Euryarchaeota archaeon]